MHQPDFIRLCLELGVLRFGQFTLKSGRLSPYFFNAGLFNTGHAIGSLGRYIDVFGRAPGNQLERKTWNGVAWSGWSVLDGVLVSGPDSSSWAGGRLDAFVAGTDGALWQTGWDGGTRSPWLTVGGVLTSDPGAVSWGPGRMDVFARGTDGQLWHRPFQ